MLDDARALSVSTILGKVLAPLSILRRFPYTMGASKCAVLELFQVQL